MQGNFTYGGPSQPVQASVQLLYQEVNCSSATVPPTFSGSGQLIVHTESSAFAFTTVSATYDKCTSSWAISADSGDEPWNIEGLTVSHLSASFLISPLSSNVSSRLGGADTRNVTNVLYGYISGAVAIAGAELGVTVNFNSVVGVENLILNFAYSDAMVSAQADLFYNRTCGSSGVRTQGSGVLTLGGISDSALLYAKIFMIYYGDCATTDLLWSLSGSASLNSIYFCTV